MSVEAITWALKQPVPHSPAKFVLVVLANQANGNLAWPSVAYLAGTTAQNRKTVMANLRRLKQWGLIEDTGERRGRTGQVPVYRLVCERDLFDAITEPEIGTAARTGTRTQCGTGTQTALGPNRVGNGTGFDPQRYQFRNTEPLETRATDVRASARTHEAHPEPSAGALATRAMIAAGMPYSRVNPSHPELLRALAAGVVPAELADVVREFISRGTGPPALVYVIRTAVGRRREAANQPRADADAPATRSPTRRRGAPRSAIERMHDAIVAARGDDA